MKIIPFGDRILLKRVKAKEVRKGETYVEGGAIIAPDTNQESKTDVAVVVKVPDHTFTDEKIIENSEKIVNSLVDKANEGDSDSFVSLLRFNDYLKIKTLKEGDKVFLGTYRGVDFEVNGESLTMASNDEIIGVITDE